jgi:hypothetical protein
MDVGDRSPGGASDESVLRALSAGFETIAAGSSEVLWAVAEAAERRLWERDGATCITAWLAARHALTRKAAAEWVLVARALQHLPCIARAYASGSLSWEQLRPLARFATPETDELWARRAPDFSAPRLWDEWSRHRRMLLKRENKAHRLRYLRLYSDPDGYLVNVDGVLTPEQGAALDAALTKRMEKVVLADEPLDPQGARRADALVELATRSGGGLDDAPPPAVVVHCSSGVLSRTAPRSGPWLAESESGRRFHAETVRRIACDGRIEWVFEDGVVAVGIGRRGRQVPPWLERVLRHRDSGRCRFPGCERRVFLRSHHIRHWADGGPTDLDNLVTLCSAHHRLIHEGGWRISGHPGIELRFHNPKGRALARASPAVVAA